MVSEEHKLLSQYIKEVHLSLRKSALQLGADNAWQRHCGNEDTLSKYAQCMEKLATTHWENNCNSDTSEATSRIKWVVEFCYDYFAKGTYEKYRNKEINICNKINVHVDTEECFSEPIQLLDVGSCYNPFKIYEVFDVLAIDLYPANASVLQCDFLNVNLGPHNVITGNMILELQQDLFDVVTFCFLLEYIPTSDLRIIACEKAYRILKPGGLLIITTPDSKHVGANCKIMKSWRYTLAHIGFSRIKYEKSKYMHCMAFRKSINKEISKRWALLYKEPFMKFAIHIPQDKPWDIASEKLKHLTQEIIKSPYEKGSVACDFQELPFCNLEEV